MPESFKRCEVEDLFSPERKATFERPHEDNDTIVINTNGATDFHLDAGTLNVIAEILSSSPSTKAIK